jgi:uncharacterized cofD-like protein
MNVTAPGPRVVALGGGRGLSRTLAAVRTYAGHVTAVVSVADDGGSSGRLRTALGIPAPGDLRRCLVALGDPASVWARTFEHRFGESDGDLAGHPLGNLVIAALASATGDFVEAVAEAGRLVGVVGTVLPATTGPVTLVADADSGPVSGEVAVSQAGRLSRVALRPADATAPEAAVDAILGAHQVILGPGSLFTSVIAATLAPSVREALAATTARKVYVCNLVDTEREAAGYDVAAHVDALLAHGVEVDVVLCDTAGLALGTPWVPCVTADMARPDGTHDTDQLARALADLLACTS